MPSGDSGTFTDKWCKWYSQASCYGLVNVHLHNRVRAILFNTTFKNTSVISLQSVFSAEETGVPGKNHRPVTDKLYHMLYEHTSPLAGFELTTLVVIGTGSCKSN